MVYVDKKVTITMIDLHVHVLGEGGIDTQLAYERLLEFQNTALRKGIDYLGLAEHTYAVDQEFYEMAMKTKSQDLNVLLGIEADYDLNADVALELAERVPLDYIVGSVHQLDGWAFDLESEQEQYAQWDPDDLYRRYFSRVRDMVRQGHFDIVGHLDLLKKFSFWPRTPMVELASSLLTLLGQAQTVVEVNSSGWFKPAKDSYPGQAILERLFELNVPVTLGSDAHEPGEVGRELARAENQLKEIGYTQLAVFNRRRRYFINI